MWWGRGPVGAVGCVAFPSEERPVAVVPVVRVQPRPALDFSQWPGNDVCISCRFAMASLICALELAALVLLYNYVTGYLHVAAARRGAVSVSAHLPTAVAPQLATSNLLLTLAVVGAGYWALIFLLYWNFIAYVMLLGPVLVLPALLTYWNGTANVYVVAPSPLPARPP